MTLTLQPASSFPVKDIASWLTRSFEAYFVPIEITETVLLTMIRRDSIDLTESRVILKDDIACGVALIARRGWTSRIGAMGIMLEARHSGIASWAMPILIEEARARGDREMVLEVITKNESAVKLYQKNGFGMIRTLVGYKHSALEAGKEKPQDFSIRELGRLVTLHGLRDLPWQLSGETVASHVPPACAFKLGDAYALISNPTVEHISILSVLVTPGARSAGQSLRMMRALAAQFPDKTWHVPALYPQEMGIIFEKAGFMKEELEQYQMSLTL